MLWWAALGLVARPFPLASAPSAWPQRFEVSKDPVKWDVLSAEDLLLAERNGAGAELCWKTILCEGPAWLVFKFSIVFSIGEI